MTSSGRAPDMPSPDADTNQIRRPPSPRPPARCSPSASSEKKDPAWEPHQFSVGPERRIGVLQRIAVPQHRLEDQLPVRPQRLAGVPIFEIVSAAIFVRRRGARMTLTQASLVMRGLQPVAKGSSGYHPEKAEKGKQKNENKTVRSASPAYRSAAAFCFTAATATSNLSLRSNTRW